MDLRWKYSRCSASIKSLRSPAAIWFSVRVFIVAVKVRIYVRFLVEWFHHQEECPISSPVISWYAMDNPNTLSISKLEIRDFKMNYKTVPNLTRLTWRSDVRRIRSIFRLCFYMERRLCNSVDIFFGRRVWIVKLFCSVLGNVWWNWNDWKIINIS